MQLRSALALLLAAPAFAQTHETCGVLATHLGEAPGDSFGFIVRNALDTDMDNVNDYVVGAVASNAGGLAAGRGYLYSGATGALRFTFTGVAGENFGWDAHPAGDVNGDGYGDVIFGAPDASNATAGAAYVYSGLDGALLYSYVGEAAGDRFGQVANRVGDIDNDGYGDFGIGAKQHASVGPNRGRVYLYSGFDGSLLDVLDGDANEDQFGAGVATLGDRDGDGHDDFILGADQGFVGRGRAYVYDGATRTRVCTLLPPSTGAIFGRSMLGIAGDLTGDGTPDFFVADFADNANRGRARVYDGTDCSLLYELTGEKAGDTFGTGSGWAGDIDGDGKDDLAFGALGGGSAGRGHLRLFSGPDGKPLGRITGSIAGDGFGFSASGAGDLDGDGRVDFLVGAPAHDGGRGVVYAVPGFPAPPRPTCDGGLNGNGTRARLATRDSLSIGQNVLRLRLEAAAPNETAVFFYGLDRTLLPLAGGQLCVAPPLFRAGPPIQLGAAGFGFLDLDLAAPPFNAGPGGVSPGSPVHFQCWYRDPGGPGGANLSAGLYVTFCP